MKTRFYVCVAAFTALVILMYSTAMFGSYLIGAYVYNRVDYENSNDTLGVYLQNAHFNTAISDAWEVTESTAIQSMINGMNNYGVDVIMNDFAFDPDDQIYGARTMSMGNYFRFEAEYCNSSSVSPDEQFNPESYFYRSSNADSARVGAQNLEYENSYSNGYYWLVDNGQTGYAYKDLTYKWPIDNSIEYNRVGREFRFPKGKTGNDAYFADNELFITYAMNCDVTSLPDTTVLAAISFTCKGEQTDSSQNTSLLHYPDLNNPADSCLVSYITKAMYENSPTDSIYIQNHLITVSIPLKSLLYNGALSMNNNAEYVMLINLNPQLYWYGYGTLKLDYIKFQDKLHRDYTSNNSVLAQIRTFGQPYLMGFDEPQQGQFDSFDKTTRCWESITENFFSLGTLFKPQSKETNLSKKQLIIYPAKY